MITNPTNSFEWIIYLAQHYSSMFLQGTLLTLYIAVTGTLLGSCWDTGRESFRISGFVLRITR